MNKKRKQIVKMDLDEISLVTSGDDPSAVVVISKARPSVDKSNNDTVDSSTMSATTPSEDVQMGTEINKAGASADLLEYVDGLEELVNEAIEGGFLLDPDSDESDSDDDEKTEPKAEAGDEDEDSDEDDTDESVEKSAPTLDEILKSNPAVAEAISKANDRAEAAEKIAKSERDARVHREMIEKAVQLPFIVGTVDEKTELLVDLYAADAQLGKRVETVLKAANAASRESEVFKQYGSERGSGSDTVDARAEEIMKADPTLSKEAAIVRVFEADPSLYLTEGA
jgi:hypothetical protein